MLIVRFLFGSGWWITWYLAFHAAVALFVVLTLFIFGSEVKPAGQPPDPASPGSMMVFMIMLTLAGLTLVDSILFVRVLAAPGLLKTALVVAATAVVAVAGYKLNADLALAQSRPGAGGQHRICGDHGAGQSGPAVVRADAAAGVHRHRRWRLAAGGVTRSA
jgi:hypothetical protein